MRPSRHLGRLTEGEVEAVSSGQWVGTVLQWVHSVVAQSGGPAPDEDVAMSDRHADGLVGTFQTSEEKDSGKPERDGDDWFLEIVLVLVLMQREPCAWLIAIDEAGIWYEGRVTRFCRCFPSQVHQHIGYDWPGWRSSRDRP